MRAEKVPEDVSWRLFFAFEKTFFKVSVQNFCHYFTWDHWLTKFLIVFLQIKFRIAMCNLHWCYTWTAQLSANQNRVIFSCILLSMDIKPFVWWTCLCHCCRVLYKVPITLMQICFLSETLISNCNPLDTPLGVTSTWPWS